MNSHRWLIFFSILSSSLLIISLISLSFLFYDIKSFYDESIEDMDTFTIYAERAWTEMKSSPPSSSSPHSSLSPSIIYGRHPRSAAICQCGPIPVTPCKPGPPGAVGRPGVPGEDGQHGPDGDVGTHTTGYDHPCPKPACYSCPPGPPGRPGADGLVGNPGPLGQPGEPGSEGYGTSVGPRGTPGDRGAPGREGEVGVNGRPGDSATFGRGNPGLAGPPGERGPIGREGERGKRAPDGIPGPGGPPGEGGRTGSPGQSGRNGSIGNTGETGTDAAYCPCPKRNTEHGEKSYTHGGSVGTRKRSGDVYKKKWNRAYDQGSTVITVNPPLRYHDQQEAEEAIILDGGDSD